MTTYSSAYEATDAKPTDVRIQVLSVSTRRLWCRLIGHNHLIVGAAMVHFVDARQGRQTRTITGDQMGEFFIWDIGNGQVKSQRGVSR